MSCSKKHGEPPVQPYGREICTMRHEQIQGYTNEWEELKTNNANAKERTTPPQVQVVKVRMSTKSVAYGCFCLWRVALVSGEVKKRREAGPPWVGTGGLLGLFGHGDDEWTEWAYERREVGAHCR